MSKFTLFILLIVIIACNYSKHEDDKLPVKILAAKRKSRAEFKKVAQMADPINILESTNIKDTNQL